MCLAEPEADHMRSVPVLSWKPWPWICVALSLEAVGSQSHGCAEISFEAQFVCGSCACVNHEAACTMCVELNQEVTGSWSH